VKQLTHGSLFAGIGGFDLGFERAGIKTVWQVEIDPFCRKILERHWPNVKRFNDIRQCGQGNLPAVDVICGGFPCQDISYAGKGAGIDAERSGLWSEYVRIIGELGPRYVVVENVAALLDRGMERVLGNLATLGYDAEWGVLCARDFGLPHRRERVLIVAYPNSLRRQKSSKRILQFEKPGEKSSYGNRWDVAPSRVQRMDDGISEGLDRRLHAIGNAVVPQIAEWIGRGIIASL
jgi:DNA (cytosine-5)-methyltransferase 1